jgi:hypothetical protein
MGIMCANPDDAGVRAQYNQAVQELAEAAGAVRVLEVKWGFVALAPASLPTAP